MDELSIDAAVVASESNFVYLSGYRTNSWANRARPILFVLPREGPAIGILSEGELARFEEEAVQSEGVGYGTVRPGESDQGFMGAASRTLISLLKRLEARRVGFELSSYFLSSLSLRAFADVEQAIEMSREGAILDISPTLRRLRHLKSAYELGCLRRAATVLGQAYERFEERAQPGMSERQLATHFSVAAMSAGADRVGYISIVADTRRGSLGGPSEHRWTGESMLLFDAGIVVDGYWADLNRMYTGGTPTSDQHQAYEQLVSALARGRAVARPGATCGDLARALLGQTKQALFGRVGHGIGLELTEPPSLGPTEASPLEAGMTLCIEPNVADDEVGSVVGEEEVLITDAGVELLSPPFPHEPRMLG